MLVLFGFSHCAVVCPRELSKLGSALDLLGPLADRIQPLYITVDPARDSPQVLRQYLSRYAGGAGAFIGLTGSAGQLEAARRSFRVFARQVTDPCAPGGYVVPHTAHAYLMAGGGQYLTHFPESLDAATIATRLREHMEQRQDA
ncbi:protein SCO1/2 [Variovorax sp. OV329]|nr:protein SCO1/2 [Variovorax sp. OV329]